MDLNLSSLIQSAETSASQAWGDITTTGVPAAQAAVESWAASSLTEMAKKDQAVAQTGVQNIANRPASAPGSFGAVLNGMIGKIGSSAALKNFGPAIILGVVVVAVAGYVMLSD